MASLPPEGVYLCTGGCGRTVVRPGCCPDCGAVREEGARRARIRARIAREIPERFRWATLDHPLLGERITGAEGKACRLRAVEPRSRVVLLGEAGSGKTTLACAWLRACIEADPAARHRYIAAHDLAAPGYVEGVSRLELALSAEALVLDDLGAELAGAGAGTGVAAQRIEAVVRLVRVRADRDLGMVVTTTHDAQGIAGIYGDGVARRLFEGATVVRCGKGA